MSDIYFGDPLTYLKGNLLQAQAQGQVYENQARGLAVTQAMDAMTRMAGYRSFLAGMTGMPSTGTPTTGAPVTTPPPNPGVADDNAPGGAGFLADLANGAAPNDASQPSAVKTSATSPSKVLKQSDMAMSEFRSAQTLRDAAMRAGLEKEVDTQQQRMQTASSRYDSAIAAEHKEKAEQMGDFYKVLHDGIDNPLALNVGLKNLETRYNPDEIRQAIHQAGIPYDPATDSYVFNADVNNRLKQLAPAAYTAQQQFENQAKAIELQEKARKDTADIENQRRERQQKDVENALSRERLKTVEQPRAAAEIANISLTRTNQVANEVQSNLNQNDLLKNIDKFRVADKFATDLTQTIDAMQPKALGKQSNASKYLNPVQSQQLVTMLENTSNLWRSRMGGGSEQEDVKELSGRLQKMGNYLSTIGEGQSIPVSAAREVIENLHDIHNDVVASAYATEAKAVQAAAARDPTGNAAKGLQLTVFNEPGTLSKLVQAGKAQINEFWPGTKYPKTVTVQGQTLRFDKPGAF